MSIKRILPERGSYDVTASTSELQERCNKLTNVITATAEITPGYNRSSTPCISQPQQLNEMPSTSTCPFMRQSSTSTSSSIEVMTRNPSMRQVDAIVEAPLASNPIGFHSYETDRNRTKDADTRSTGSKSSNKCENCVVDCLYYTNECCDCTIV